MCYIQYMSKKDKLLNKLLAKPKDLKYSELKTILMNFGYEETQGGITSGSAVAFIDKKSSHIIRLHKPHAQNALKQYQIEHVIDVLRSRRLL